MSTLYSGNYSNGLEADYSVDEVAKLRSPEVLPQIKLLLLGMAVIVRVRLQLALNKVFSPSEFIGQDGSIWKGPIGGNGLEGEEDRDSREDSLDIVDLEQLILETNLRYAETSVNGEEKLRRLKASKNIRLGGKAFSALWNDYRTQKAYGKPEESILEKLRRLRNVDCIYFFGLVLRGPDGHRYVLCLFFDEEWTCAYNCLDNDWGAPSPSASLENVDQSL